MSKTPLNTNNVLLKTRCGCDRLFKLIERSEEILVPLKFDAKEGLKYHKETDFETKLSCHYRKFRNTHQVEAGLIVYEEVPW